MRKLPAVLGVLAAAGLTMAGTAAASAAPHPTASGSTGTVISVGNTAFGSSVVVGSGKFKGFTTYMLSSDHGTVSSCTSALTKTVVGPIQCTGGPKAKNAEWPAVTTTGTPVAGPGIKQSLLGTRHRKFGLQVTYAGHPLYLFDQQPGAVTGMGWDEPSLPPWHGVWSLLSPSGQALWWEGQLTATRVSGHTVLAARMLTGVGWINFPVYTRAAACTGACALVWPYTLTSGVPGAGHGVSAGQIGAVQTPQGSQVTYRGQRLYYFANEGLNPATLRATGNGNGVGGFHFVTP
jgi:predicted lipoprotein with Yx(FWY)xxD motif